MSSRGGAISLIVGLLCGILLGGWLLFYKLELGNFRLGSSSVDDTSGQVSSNAQGTAEGPDTVAQPGGGVSPAYSLIQAANQRGTQRGADSATAESTVSGSRDNAIVRATRKVAPAVVSINVVQAQAVRDPSLKYFEDIGLIPRQNYTRKVKNMGSGVIISSDGLIITNLHVVQASVETIVTLSDGRQFKGELLGGADRYDLALLKINGENLPIAIVADSDDLTIGEWAIAIGSPFGYLLADTQPTVTVGVISAINRDIKQAEGERTYLGMIQTDAAINPGNSGGPLINADGEIIGINTFIFSGTGGNVGIGFAVPVSRVHAVMDEILTYGHVREFHLGVSLAPLTPNVLHYFNITNGQGFLVAEVQEGSPAWNGGLRLHDVLREVAGQRLTSYDILIRLIYESSVGDCLPFTAERAGQMFTGEIMIEEWQE